MATFNSESPSRGGVMVTNLNDVELEWDPLSGEKIAMVQSQEKRSPVRQNGDAKEICEAVIKKCSKVSDPVAVPKDLNDSNIIGMIDDLELSMEDKAKKNDVPSIRISKSPMHANNVFLTRKSLLPKPEISPKPAHLKSNRMGAISPNSNGMSLPPLGVNQMTGSVHLPAGGPTFHVEEKPSSPVVVQHIGFPLSMSSSCNVIPPTTKVVDVPDSSSLPRATQEVSAKALNEKSKGTSSMLKNTLKRITKLSIKAASKDFGNPDQDALPDRPQSSHSALRRSMSPFRSAKKSNSPPQEPPRTKNEANFLRKKKSLENICSSRAYGPHARGTSSSNPSSLNRNKSLRRSNEAFKVPVVENVNVKSLSRSTSNSSSSSNVPLSMANRSHSLKRAGRNKDLSNGNSLQRSGSGMISSSGVKRSNSMHQSQYGNRRFRDRDLNVRLSRGTQTRLTRDAINDEDDRASVEDVGTDPITTSNVEFTLYMPDLLGVDTANDFETHINEPLEPVDVRKNRQLTLDNMKLHREIEKLKSAANESDHLKRELRSVRSRLEEEQRSRARIEHELDQHNGKVKLIAKTMDSVEQEFERRDQTVKQLEGQLHQKRSQIKTLEDKLRVANDVISSQNRDIAAAVASQKSAVREYERAEVEANELHEFLQAEKFTLAEALKEAEVEAATLKVKLESSEERCGHLVRLGEQRHQGILALEAQLKAMEMKAKEMLLTQGAELTRSTVLIAELSNKVEEAFKATYPELYKSLCPEISNDVTEYKGIEEELIEPEDEEESEDNSLMLVSGADQSLQNLSNAIKNRVSAENGVKPQQDSSSAPSLVDRIARTEKLLEQFILAQKEQQQSLAADGPPVSTKNVISQANGVTECPADQKENIAINGNESLKDQSNILRKYEEEMAEMKAKYLKHRQILVTNREAAESEVMRLDDIFHDTVNDVLQTLASLPEVVKSNGELSKLQARLQTALLDEDLTNEDSNGKRANGSGKTTEIMNQLNNMKPNGNLIAGPPTSSEQSL